MMSVARSIQYVLSAVVFFSMTTFVSPIWSAELPTSMDYKNGLAVGMAIEAKWSANLCCQLLERWVADENTDKLQEKEAILAHLFRNAEVIHSAIALPDHALPEEMRNGLEKHLTIISDCLHEAAPEVMNANKYIEGRIAQIEWLRKHNSSEEMRKTLLGIYDRQTEIVKVLDKYRSAQKCEIKVDSREVE